MGAGATEGARRFDARGATGSTCAAREGFETDAGVGALGLARYASSFARRGALSALLPVFALQSEVE